MSIAQQAAPEMGWSPGQGDQDTYMVENFCTELIYAEGSLNFWGTWETTQFSLLMRVLTQFTFF